MSADKTTAAPPSETRYVWWCDECAEEVPGQHVTYQERHDPRYGGCGCAVETIPEKDARRAR